jgi:hypothetical protein
MSEVNCDDLIPQSVVRLNRTTIVFAVVAASLLRQPLITTALFIVIALATLFGRRWSLPYQLRRLTHGIERDPHGDDPRLMRFNNALAAIMLGCGQIAFLAGAPIAGWVFCYMTAIAALVALSGFCVGCWMFYQFKLNRYRLFGR